MDERDVDPRLNEAVQRLGKYLEGFRGLLLDDRIVEKVEQDVHSIVVGCRMRGISMPDLAVVFLRKVGAIEVFRKDLEARAVRTVVVNMTVKYPDVDMEELTWGIDRAFPDYRRAVSLIH